MVIASVGQFIDFRRYLGLAVVKGAEEASKYAKHFYMSLYIRNKPYGHGTRRLTIGEKQSEYAICKTQK